MIMRYLTLPRNNCYSIGSNKIILVLDIPVSAKKVSEYEMLLYIVSRDTFIIIIQKGCMKYIPGTLQYGWPYK